MASLLVRTLVPAVPQRLYRLVKEVTVLGRCSDCDVVVPNLETDRHHARIIRVGDRFYIEDTASHNGTWVRRTGAAYRIEGQTLLEDGDAIWLGSEVVASFRE
jgi:pSer/pThr/pTyr-binding forkhead associated (FHA) protein